MENIVNWVKAVSYLGAPHPLKSSSWLFCAKKQQRHLARIQSTHSSHKRINALPQNIPLPIVPPPPRAPKSLLQIRSPNCTIPIPSARVTRTRVFPPPISPDFVIIARICQLPSPKGTPRTTCHVPSQTLIRPWIARRASSKLKVRRSIAATLLLSSFLTTLPELSCLRASFWYYALPRPILTSSY